MVTHWNFCCHIYIQHINMFLIFWSILLLPSDQVKRFPSVIIMRCGSELSVWDSAPCLWLWVKKSPWWLCQGPSQSVFICSTCMCKSHLSWPDRMSFSVLAQREHFLWYVSMQSCDKTWFPMFRKEVCVCVCAAESQLFDSLNPFLIMTWFYCYFKGFRYHR